MDAAPQQQQQQQQVSFTVRMKAGGCGPVLSHLNMDQALGLNGRQM